MGFRRSETILASALLGDQQPSSNPLEVGSYSITLQRMLYSYSSPTSILCFLVFIALILYFTMSDYQVVRGNSWPSGQRETWLKEKRFESAYSAKDSECPKWRAV